MFYIDLGFFLFWIFSLIVGVLIKEDKEDIFHNIAWIFNFGYLTLLASSLSLPVVFNYGAEAFLVVIWAVDSYGLYKTNNSVKFIAFIMTGLWVSMVIMRFTGTI